MKKRRFAAGGDTSFSAEQLKWLGGADRTDPYILARMRRAVPDTPNRAPVEDREFKPIRPEAKAPERAAPAADETPKRAEPKVSTPRAAAAPQRAEPKVSAAAAEPDRTRRTTLYQEPSKAEDTPMSRIPGVVSDKGPTDSKGNSASGSELTRRLSNIAMALPGMGGIRAAQTAASAATAGKAARTAAEAVKNRERVTNPLYWMAGPKNASKFDGSAAAAKVAAKPAAKPAAKMTKADKEKAKRAGELRSANNPTKFSSSSKKQDVKNTRFKEDEAGIEFKRGGAVKRYANGGSVSSRADGIAARGRTRGKMY